MKKENETNVDIEIETSGIGRASGDDIDETIDNYQEARGTKNAETLESNPYE